MSIVMSMSWTGLTPDEYDAVREIADWERDNPAGGLLHVAWFDDNGLRVCDVWSSQEALDAFIGSRLMPAVAKAGITSEPSTTISPCHAAQRELIIGGRLFVEESAVPADVYDTLAASADWVADPPIGGICHIAADSADGMVNVVSVWRSVQASVNFALERLAVVAAELSFELGIDGNPPQLAVAHAVYSPPTVNVTA